MAALDYLRGVGLSVEIIGDKLRVTPANLITEAIGQFVRDHKTEIIVELSAANETQHFIHTAATAAPEWRKARDQYISHLMTCRACHAATGRYCAAGADLRQRYDNTPMD